MQVFVSLYWGGKIVQLPHLGIGYDPPRARDGIVFDSCVSYSELVARICATMKIDMNQHTIELSWKHSIGQSYICTGIHNDQSVMYMFKEAQSSTGHIELIVEYASVRNSERQPTVDYGVVDYGVVDCGVSSARVEHVSVDCGITGQADVADVVDVGMNNQVDVADADDIPDRHHPDISSASSEGSFSDESGGGNVSSDDEIIYKPVVRGEQPLPKYDHTGLPFFRNLPRGGGTSVVPDENEEDNRYWDEKKPTRILLGMKFQSKLHVKTAVTLWHVRRHRYFKVVESKLRRWHAVCKKPFGVDVDTDDEENLTEAERANKCTWGVSVTQMAHDDMWEIRKWKERHSCEGHRNNRGHANLSSSMIAVCILHQLEEDAEFKASSVRKFVADRFDVAITYKKAWYARRKAIEIVFGGWEESFRQLPSYIVLTIDGTHLRGRLRGKLLVACGFDANHNCLPIAYAVVDEETNDSWEWFMNLVRHHVVKYDREVCIISDRHKGIFKAMSSREWQREPKCHHKYCLIHVRKNVLQKYKGGKVKSKIWKLGVSTQIRKFEAREVELHSESSGALRMLNRIGKENWSLCYDDELRWGRAQQNMSESYNKVLRAVRELPIRALIDLTFWRTVGWWVDRNTQIQHTEGRLTPWARDMLDEYDGKGQKHQVRTLDRRKAHYQIRSRPRLQGKGNNKQKVEYLDSKCSCGKWQMWKIHCSHACAVARERGDNMFELINKVYHKSTWEAQYSGVFDAPRHEDYWVEPEWNLFITPEQLLPRRRGRGRRRRIPNRIDVREEDEPRARRHCRNCGEEGHDRRNCKVV